MDKKYMKIAVDEAMEGITKKHGGPFGCVIVKDGKILGKAHNRVLLKHDPTCHGEMEAIRDACANLGSQDLSGCELYTTAAPCPMCKGAILWAKISKVYYGCTVEDTDTIKFNGETFYTRWNSQKDLNFGEEFERKMCLELFGEYTRIYHENL